MKYIENNNCSGSVRSLLLYSMIFFILCAALVLLGACSNDMGQDKMQPEVLLVFDDIKIFNEKKGKLVRISKDADASVREIESIAKNNFFDVFANLQFDPPDKLKIPILQLSVDLIWQSQGLLSAYNYYKVDISVTCYDPSGNFVGTFFVRETQEAMKFSQPVGKAMHDLVGKVKDWPQLQSFAEGQVSHAALAKSSQIAEKPRPFAITRDKPTNYFAVIIGISEYQYSGKNGLNTLIYADDDAKAFACSLGNLGWAKSHIKLLTNEEATEKNIRIALEAWLTKAGSNDQIVLFWAGHGFPDPEDPEKVYFACYDTDINIPATGYRMDKVRTALEEKKSKNVIVLADTCHAGKLITRGNRGISIVPNIKEQNTPKGWVFMVGADTDRQAVEHSAWSNGAFTHSLIKGLSGKADGFQSAGAKDGIVTMGELKDYMKTAMPDETQKVLGVAKHPVITTSTGDPNIWNLTLQVTQ